MTVQGRRSSTFTRLLRHGFTDPSAAERLLDVAEMASVRADPVLLDALGATADPDLALRGLVRLVEAHEPDDRHRLLDTLLSAKPLRDRLLGVLGASEALGDHLARHPADWQVLVTYESADLHPGVAEFEAGLELGDAGVQIGRLVSDEDLPVGGVPGQMVPERLGRPEHTEQPVPQRLRREQCVQQPVPVVGLVRLDQPDETAERQIGVGGGAEGVEKDGIGPYGRHLGDIEQPLGRGRIGEAVPEQAGEGTAPASLHRHSAFRPSDQGPGPSLVLRRSRGARPLPWGRIVTSADESSRRGRSPLAEGSWAYSRSRP